MWLTRGWLVTQGWLGIAVGSCNATTSFNFLTLALRYHWIDSVWKSRSYADALKENPINLSIFWKLNSYRIHSYLSNFLKANAEVILKEIPRNTDSFNLVRFRAWIIGAARLTSGMFSHTSPSKRVSAIFRMWFGFCFRTPKVWYYQHGRSFLQKRP